MKDMLAAVKRIYRNQYAFYEGSGYNERVFMYVPFSGSVLPEIQRHFNKVMAKARVTVEWYFKEVKHFWWLLG